MEAETEPEVRTLNGAGVDVLQRFLTNRPPRRTRASPRRRTPGDDADGWLSDVSESKDDDGSSSETENTHDWADTSVEVAEETPRADA